MDLSQQKEFDQLEASILKRSTQFELLKVENTNLREAIKFEKQRTKRRKQLEMPSEYGGAQFFSPNKIALARELQQQQEEAEQLEKE
ncbi:MAG: hypothetical protein M1822_009573 [Bathelium mastoideum]|nr:MAG: hypothetical protein M1822_009573 [Bathelium mastoideum]